MNIDRQSAIRHDDPDGLKIFFGDHAFAHETIAGAVAASTQLVHFPMADVGDIRDWLRLHDAAHQSIAAALNLGTPPDLQNVDFSDEQQFNDWMNNHMLMHDLINTTLGI